MNKHNAAAQQAPAVLGARAVDLTGQLHRLGLGDRPRPVAIVFLDTECPIARRYAVRLNEIARDAEELGVEFYGVLASADTTAAGGADGRKPPTARTQPVGWLFESSTDLPKKPTYTRHIEPILRTQCVECHRQGDVGPFALTSYPAAKRRARMLAKVCRDDLMPPWRAAAQATRFRDERGLSEREVELLAAWARAGAPEGDPANALPAPAAGRSEWRLGEPDLVVELPLDYQIPADGEDIYRVPGLRSADRADRGPRRGGGRFPPRRPNRGAPRDPLRRSLRKGQGHGRARPRARLLVVWPERAEAPVQDPEPRRLGARQATAPPARGHRAAPAGEHRRHARGALPPDGQGDDRPQQGGPVFCGRGRGLQDHRQHRDRHEEHRHRTGRRRLCQTARSSR